MNRTTYYDFDITYSLKSEDIVHMTFIEAASLAHAVRQIALLHDCSAEEIEIHRSIMWAIERR
ncbi:MAG: hypothetical protein J6S49_08025 [Erysipelotrichaceae bacterium]|nr:hypothetical protein [Erysipelotrichaceae bacterium]